MTAFNFEVKIIFADGTSEVVPGLGRDFLMSLGVLPPGHSGGVLPPGDRRSQELATFPASHIQRHVVHTEATARCVIFDDATAVGDEQRIEGTFRNRREMLDEFTFWKQTVAKHRERISNQGPLASLLDLSAVRAPQRSRIMVQMAEYALDGKVSLAYPASGLVWELAAPVERALENECLPAPALTFADTRPEAAGG